jgi:hypothetical protein
MLLTTGAAAKSVVPDAVDRDSDVPLYLQLMAYVSQLLTAGEEVPKSLINKIQQYYKQGK